LGRAKATRQALQRLLDGERFTRTWGFRVLAVSEGGCRLMLPFRRNLERPGGIVNGPALMAAADCAMWLAVKATIGMDHDALTSDLATAFLAPARREPVYCTARVLRAGRRRIFGTAECHSRGGRVFSHHTITYVQVS
jgi:uncharacterized protein (TIGR00369 family)